MADTSDKTEKATPRKRAEARRQGNVARSVELPQAISLLVAAIALPSVVPQYLAASADEWRLALGPDTPKEPGLALGLLGSMCWSAAVTFAPMVLAVLGTSVAAQMMLAGTVPNLRQLKPKMKSLNVYEGIKRLFSKQSLWELARTVAKLGLLAAVTWGVWLAGAGALVDGAEPLPVSIAVLGQSLDALILRAAALGAVIGLADAVVSRRRYNKQLRMSRQEVKDEHRQSEGDPIIKGEIRRRQAKLSRNRMIAAVASATVVVTNPTHLAVALAYDPTQVAPRVVAKGAGSIAKRIREEATRNGVPIQENKPLARTLFRSVEIGEFVPADLYAAVAEVLAAVFRARRRR